MVVKSSCVRPWGLTKKDHAHRQYHERRDNGRDSCLPVDTGRLVAKIGVTRANIGLETRTSKFTPTNSGKVSYVVNASSFVARFRSGFGATGAHDTGSLID